MDNVSIEKVDDVYVRVNADPGIKMEMSEYFTFEVPGAKFMPAVRNKVWDGKIRLLNTMTGMIYAGLIPYILKFCNTREYHVPTRRSYQAFFRPMPVRYHKTCRQIGANAKAAQNLAIVAITIAS